VAFRHTGRMSSPLGLAGPVDLSPVELRALELDGVVFRVGPAWCSVGEIDGPALRLRSLSGVLPEGVAAARRTAAWAWGATGTAPVPVEACVDVARRHTVQVPGVRVSEVVLPSSDLAGGDGEGPAVTTPVRTALDLLRGDEWDDAVAVLVSRLVADHGIDRADLRDRLGLRRRLPHKRRALVRLAAVEDLLSPR